MLTIKRYAVAIGLLLLVSCQTRYAITQSKRSIYSINANVPVDSGVIKIYMPYKLKLDQEMMQVIGFTTVDLTERSSLPESVLGNFFADAIHHQAQKIVPNIDLSYATTRGGLRNDIPKGAITVAQVFELMPFENKLILFEIKGADLMKVLTGVAAGNGQPIAGLQMAIKDNKPSNVIINGAAFDPQKTYRVLTSDYLSGGGDDTQGFSNPISKKDIGLLVRDAILNEVKEVQALGKTINTKLDGRITKN